MERRTADRRTGTDRRAPEPQPIRPLTERDLGDWRSAVRRLR